jgi:hypothetical protein
MKKIYVVLLCMMACLMACEKDIDFGKTKLVVETNKVTPDYTSAIIECAIATDATVNEVYLQYTTDSMFFDYHEADMTEYIRKCYRAEIVDLQENTVYYYRYLVRNALSSAMSGGVEAFQTLGRQQSSSDNGTENGYEYVDLGLSVKWATCNVGASKPEEYGDYFAWGETEPKDYYDLSSYKWCNGSYYAQTKYCTDSYYGTVDNKTTLDLSDDAARANWGGSWRMPTDAELTELREQCTWTWTSQNGVYGYKVTSKKSGYTNKSIFLPAAGIRSGSSLNSAGSSGYYWSSSLYTDYPGDAWRVEFYSNGVGRNNGYRLYGFSVRPVCQ